MDTQQDRLVKHGVIIGMHLLLKYHLKWEYVDIQFLNESIGVKKQMTFVIYLEMNAHGKHP